MPIAMLEALFWIAAGTCAVAQLFIVRAVFRPAIEPATGSVPAPHRLQEIAWAIIPAVLLTAAFVFAWRAMHRMGGVASIGTLV